MDILIVGTGYVGLVTGTCLAEMGHQVTCLDINFSKISQLSSGHVSIYEPGLEEMVRRNLAAKRLSFTTDYVEGVRQSRFCFIAVDTPQGENGQADLQYVFKAAEMIAQHMNDYKIIINKSTVPVGTAHAVKKVIRQTLSSRKVSCEFDIVSNPEFLKEGSAIHDCMKPDRVVIGAESEVICQKMRDLYAPFMVNHERILMMDLLSAEMTKYAANCFLGTRISFMNELALICEATGADIETVRKGIGADSRIGYQFLYAGAGFGGSCLPKDLKALRYLAKENTVQTPLLDAVDQINQTQKLRLFHKIEAYFAAEGIAGKTFGILGLAFKPDTDDMREAPSLTLIKEILHHGATVRLFDPIAMTNAKSILPDHPGIYWSHNEYDVAYAVDALVLITEWKQFRLLDCSQLLQIMKGKAFFDGRNQYSPHKMRELGFDYFSIGRPQIASQEIIEKSLLERTKLGLTLNN